MGSPSQLKDPELPAPQFPISYALQEGVSLAHYVPRVDLMANSQTPKSQQNPKEMGVLGAEPNDPNTRRPQSPTPPYKPCDFGLKPNGTYKRPPNPTQTKPKMTILG